MTHAPEPGAPVGWPRRRVLSCLLLAGPATGVAAAGGAPAASWTEALRRELERIDRATPGRLGVYVKRLDTGERLEYQARRRWYLSSSAKLPIALTVLDEVQAGRRSLGERMRLLPTDKIDGSGRVVWQPDGSSFEVGELLHDMLMDSDNTAANMLVRLVGVDRLNAHARALMGAREVGRLTDFTEVRRRVYGELHPKAATLSNRQLLEIAGAPLGRARVERFRRQLGLSRAQLKQPTIEAAYARYYASGLNQASLVGYGAMLESLVSGRLLSPALMQQLYDDLKFGSYDAYRLEAGLPKTVRFIHKTGTQLERACHMGVIDPQDGGRRAIIVAACAEGLDESKEAGVAFRRIGEAITRTVLRAGG